MSSTDSTAPEQAEAVVVTTSALVASPSAVVGNPSAPMMGIVKPVASGTPAAPGVPGTPGAPSAAPVVASPLVPRPSDGPVREPLFSHQLFRIVTGLLGFQLALLIGNLWFQFHNYATGIRMAEKAGATADIVSLVLVYSRAWDFAVTKTSALFLGFMVIYLGALYVLRSADTSYELSINQGAQSGATLKSSSPGLVMITLGALLVALVLSNRSEVGIQVDPSSAGSGAGGVSVSATTSTAAQSVVTSTTPVPAPAARPVAATPAPTRPATSPAPAPAAPAEDHRMPKMLDP